MEANKVKSKSNEGPLVQRRLSYTSSQSTVSVKQIKRSSLGPRKPSVAPTNKKVDLKKTNSYVNSLYKPQSNKVSASKGETGAFVENKADRYQLVNALEAIILQTPRSNKNIPKDDQIKAKEDQNKPEDDQIKSKDDQIKPVENNRPSRIDKIKSSNDTIEPGCNQTTDKKSAKVSKMHQSKDRQKQIKSASNHSTQNKPTIPTTKEAAIIFKASSRKSTGSLTRSSKCPAKPTRASLSPSKSSLVKPTRTSGSSKTSSIRPTRTSTPKDSSSVRSSLSPTKRPSVKSMRVSLSPKRGLSGSKTLVKNGVPRKTSSLLSNPDNVSKENTKSKIASISMPDLCKLHEIGGLKNGLRPTKQTKSAEPKVMEKVEQKFGQKLEGITAKNQLIIAKIMDQVEALESSLKLTIQGKEEQLQREKELNEQLKSDNEMQETCKQKIRETMAERELEIMKEIIGKNSQIEEFKIFSLKNADFLTNKLTLKDNEMSELSENLEKLKVILVDKDNLLQEAFDQQTVYQQKIKNYENSDKLKDDLMDDILVSHKNEIEALGMKINDKDKLAKDLKLKVSKLIAEFTKEFKEKDEELKIKTEHLKFKTREASNALVQNKILEENLLKLKKMLSTETIELEESNALSKKQSTVIDEHSSEINHLNEKLSSEINQQSIVIDNLSKEITDLKSENIKLKNLHISEKQQKLELNANSFVLIDTSDVKSIEQNNVSEDVLDEETIETEDLNETVEKNMMIQYNWPICVYEDKNITLETPLEFLDNSETSDIKVSALQCDQEIVSDNTENCLNILITSEDDTEHNLTEAEDTSNNAKMFLSESNEQKIHSIKTSSKDQIDENKNHVEVQICKTDLNQTTEDKEQVKPNTIVKPCSIQIPASKYKKYDVFKIIEKPIIENNSFEKQSSKSPCFLELGDPKEKDTDTSSVRKNVVEMIQNAGKVQPLNISKIAHRNCDSTSYSIVKVDVPFTRFEDKSMTKERSRKISSPLQSGNFVEYFMKTYAIDNVEISDNLLSVEQENKKIGDSLVRNIRGLESDKVFNKPCNCPLEMKIQIAENESVFSRKD